MSVFTINEAIKVLAEDGLVVSKSRSHRVVQAPDQAARQPVRPMRPSVLLVGGYAGSGKSELGRIVARETGWPILDKDTTTRPVVETALEIHGLPPHDRESETYLSEIRPREYEAIMATATENVECGLSVIVTAPFVQELNDVAWIDRTRAKFEGAWCDGHPGLGPLRPRHHADLPATPGRCAGHGKACRLARLPESD